MDNTQITFRKATIADAEFVATVMMEAVEIPLMEDGIVPEPDLVAICERDDTLYSWKNATIAEVNGERVGGLIAYSGKGYHEKKVFTFSQVKRKLDFDPMAMDDETREGEYYLDSLAVLPQWRGCGIGKALLMRGVEIAQTSGLLPVLACDPVNTNAHRLYRSLGFVETGFLFIFGMNYLRMTKEK